MCSCVSFLIGNERLIDGKHLDDLFPLGDAQADNGLHVTLVVLVVMAHLFDIVAVRLALIDRLLNNSIYDCCKMFSLLHNKFH